MHRIGVAGDMIYVVVHSYDRGGILLEYRSDTMMVVVIPTKLLREKNE